MLRIKREILMRDFLKNFLTSFICFSSILFCSFQAQASNGLDADLLLNMSIEEILATKITSVAKKAQNIKEISSAVYVITQDDIRRSGALTIPDILRMAPGVHVARIDGNKWSVSIRGFGDIFANDLLVMIDGRSIYNQLFAGVYWDVQDLVTEDIERVEVIRGPGASVWGANAVNGVINIITKAAKDTQGGLISAGYGSETNGFGSVRYGGKIGNDHYYRIYAKAYQQDEFKLQSGGDAFDDKHHEQTGFKLDLATDSDDPITIQGDFYSGVNDVLVRTDSLSPLQFGEKAGTHEDVRGGNIHAHWNHHFSSTSKTSTQIYYDYNYRSHSAIAQVMHNLDVDFAHNFELNDWNEVIWGLHYRFSADDLDGSFGVTVEPGQRETHLYSMFLQDEMSFFDDQLKFTAGIKLLHNDYSGFEYQPSARALWRLNDKQSVWASFSRAVRTPGRFEHEGAIKNIRGGFPVPTVAQIHGNNEFRSEVVYAYELGYRAVFDDHLFFDLALFYNEYDHSRGSAGFRPSCQPSGSFPPCFNPGDTHFLVPISLAENNIDAETYGGEFSFRWNYSDWFFVNGSYSFLQMQTHSLNHNSADEDEEGLSPHHIVTVQPSFNFDDSVSMDLWLRYTDSLKAEDIPAYFSLDARLAWRPVKNLELSVVGQNLLEESHLEFITQQNNAPPTQIERAVYGQIRYSF